jgi:hypothetical protein
MLPSTAPAFSGHVKIGGPVDPVTFCLSQAYAITVFMVFNQQGHAGPVGPVFGPVPRRTGAEVTSHKVA